MAEAPSTFMLLLRLGVSLGLVLALVGAITWVLRRRGLLRPANRGTDGRLEVLDRKALGKRASLVVARVGGTAVLVGVTDTHISVLSEAPGLDAAWLDASDVADLPVAAVHPAPPVPTTTESDGTAAGIDLNEVAARTSPTASATPSDPTTSTTVDLSSFDAAAFAAAAQTMEARRTGLLGDSPVESTTPPRMSLVGTLRELTVRRS